MSSCAEEPPWFGLVAVSALWPTDGWPLTFTAGRFPPYETSPPAAAADFCLLQTFSDVAAQPPRLHRGGRLLPSSKAPSSNREHKVKKKPSLIRKIEEFLIYTSVK